MLYGMHVVWKTVCVWNVTNVTDPRVPIPILSVCHWVTFLLCCRRTGTWRRTPLCTSCGSGHRCALPLIHRLSSIYALAFVICLHLVHLARNCPSLMPAIFIYHLKEGTLCPNANAIGFSVQSWHGLAVIQSGLMVSLCYDLCRAPSSPWNTGCRSPQLGTHTRRAPASEPPRLPRAWSEPRGGRGPGCLRTPAPRPPRPTWDDDVVYVGEPLSRSWPALSILSSLEANIL